jgi:hypothetical protein
VIGNPSPTDATVTVTLPALNGLVAFELAADGKRGSAVSAATSGGKVTLPLKAGQKVLFARS